MTFLRIIKPMNPEIKLLLQRFEVQGID